MTLDNEKLNVIYLPNDLWEYIIDTNHYYSVFY